MGHIEPAQPVSVPHDIAYRLCDDIRAEGKRKWYAWSAWWCWGCMTFTGGESAKRCGATVACPQVVERYNKTSRA